MASIARRPDGTWRPRYRDADGKEHARHFAKKADAQRWLDEVTATVVTGMYVYPKAGRITLSAFYAAWAARQVWAPCTELAMSLAVRTATFTDIGLRLLRRSHVESWVKQMTAAGRAPGTIHTRVQNVRAVLRGAVRDRVIASDPSDGVQLPRRRRREHSMSVPTPPRSAHCSRPPTSGSPPSSPSARSAASASERPLRCRSATSTSSGGGWSSADRSSEEPAAPSSCEHRSTARRAPSSSPTGCSP